jgi:class I fructose-bisphosphate aldolase
MDSRIRMILGLEADDLVSHPCKTISKDVLRLPGPAFIAQVVSITDRSPRVRAGV